MVYYMEMVIDLQMLLYRGTDRSSELLYGDTNRSLGPHNLLYVGSHTSLDWRVDDMKKWKGLSVFVWHKRPSFKEQSSFFLDIFVSCNQILSAWKFKQSGIFEGGVSTNQIFPRSSPRQSAISEVTLSIDEQSSCWSSSEWLNFNIGLLTDRILFH
jgi:hypothetical protein